MSRFVRGLTIIATLLLLVASSASGIQRVAARLNVVDFYGGYTTPLGTYDNIGGIPLVGPADGIVEIEADEAWDPSFYLGVNYSQVRNRNMLVGVGFRYTSVEIDDRLTFGAGRPSINIYDIEFNANWLFFDIRHSSWSPYFGVGFHAGITQLDFDHFSDEYETTLDLGLNFGADLKLWTAPDNRSFVTLSSINNWAFAASQERPRYLHIGGGIKYYFRP